MSPARRQPTASLFAQLLALIVLSLVGALIINLLVVLNLPPPTPDFYRMSEIALVAIEMRPAHIEEPADPSPCQAERVSVEADGGIVADVNGNALAGEQLTAIGRLRYRVCAGSARRGPYRTDRRRDVARSQYAVRKKRPIVHFRTPTGRAEQDFGLLHWFGRISGRRDLRNR